MAGATHDLLLTTIKDAPVVLGELLQRIGGLSLHLSEKERLEERDSTIRFTGNFEKRPDILFLKTGASQEGGGSESAEEDAASWVMVEIQNHRDPDKARSWHLATSVLLQKGQMGDLVVITADDAVARWAKEVCQHRGALGTATGVTPVVLHVSEDKLDRLLDPAFPDLTLFALWAVERASEDLEREAFERVHALVEGLPPPLRDQYRRAILCLLAERHSEWFKETAMDPNKIPEPEHIRRLREGWVQVGRNEGRQEGESTGKRATLLKVMAFRGLQPTPEQRAVIDAMEDAEGLDVAVLRAVSAATVADVLGTDIEPAQDLPKKNGKTNGHSH